jgi:phosphohistidine phosphatase SixA
MTAVRFVHFPLTVLSLLAFSVGSSVAAAEDEDALWAALAAGGKVVMIRHAATEEASAEVSMNLSGVGNCSQEQNLTEAGREQARLLGGFFRERQVSVDTVLTSQYCRARETAELAFGGHDTWAALNLTEAMPEDDVEFLLEDVRERIGEFDGDGTLVLITHRSNINTIAFRQTEPADMVVVEPDDFGGFTVLGAIAWTLE